jgi:AcrR family transcriptional regulator
LVSVIDPPVIVAVPNETDSRCPVRGRGYRQNGKALSASVATLDGIALPDTTGPKRKDAARNRERILDAAKDAFAERGLGATLHEIAGRAGVGVGTIYRHFPEKGPLVDAVFEAHLAEMTALFEEGLANDDPWGSIVWCHEQLLEHQARNRGLKELLLGSSPEAPERARQIRAQLHPLAHQLIERGRAAGVVRPDCETQDFGLLQTMVGAVMDAAGDVEPDLWRRYFVIALQGLRPAGAPLAPLPAAALPAERMEELIVEQWRSRR